MIAMTTSNSISVNPRRMVKLLSENSVCQTEAYPDSTLPKH